MLDFHTLRIVAASLILYKEVYLYSLCNYFTSILTSNCVLLYSSDGQSGQGERFTLLSDNGRTEKVPPACIRPYYAAFTKVSLCHFVNEADVWNSIVVVGLTGQPRKKDQC